MGAAAQSSACSRLSSLSWGLGVLPQRITLILVPPSWAASWPSLSTWVGHPRGSLGVQGTQRKEPFAGGGVPVCYLVPDLERDGASGLLYLSSQGAGSLGGLQEDLAQLR